MKVRIPSNPQKPPYIKVNKDDVFDLDYTLALIISACLKEYKKRCISYPGELEDLYPACDPEVMWREILDKMIFSFEKIAEFDHLTKYKTDYRIQEGLDLFAKYYTGLWV